jgi:hypothetical protein
VATAVTLGLGNVATPALADGLVAAGGLRPAPYAWGSGPLYYGAYAPLAYDSYVFAYEYPVYTGRTVTATAVELVNSRFRHRRVAGPGVAYYGTYIPGPYRIRANW